VIEDLNEKIHQHHPGCGHDVEAMEEELDNRPPDNAGIIETVRWAMENEKTLRNPPVQHMFCGMKIPCIYAGTIPTRTFISSMSAKKAAIKHARDFASIVMVDVTYTEGGIARSQYPSLSAIMVVVDVNSDPNDPKAHILVYDGPKSVFAGEPVVGYVEIENASMMISKRGDDFEGLNEMDLEAFVVDLESVVRDHVGKKMKEREEAIEEAKVSGVKVIEDDGHHHEIPKVVPDVSGLEGRISKMESRIENHQVSREGKKKLEKKIAAMRAKMDALKTEEISENGEDNTIIGS